MLIKTFPIKIKSERRFAFRLYPNWLTIGRKHWPSIYKRDGLFEACFFDLYLWRVWIFRNANVYNQWPQSGG